MYTVPFIVYNVPTMITNVLYTLYVYNHAACTLYSDIVNTYYCPGLPINAWIILVELLICYIIVPVA